MNGFFEMSGSSATCTPGHVGQDSPAEAHLDVVGVNLAAERGADLVEDGLAALGDDRVQVGRGIEEDRAGENHDGSDNCGGDYDDTTHMRIPHIRQLRSGSRHAASVVDARRMRIINRRRFSSPIACRSRPRFEPHCVLGVVCPACTYPGPATPSDGKKAKAWPPGRRTRRRTKGDGRARAGLFVAIQRPEENARRAKGVAFASANQAQGRDAARRRSSKNPRDPRMTYVKTA